VYIVEREKKKDAGLSCRERSI